MEYTTIFGQDQLQTRSGHVYDLIAFSPNYKYAVITIYSEMFTFDVINEQKLSSFGFTFENDNMICGITDEQEIIYCNTYKNTIVISQHDNSSIVIPYEYVFDMRVFRYSKYPEFILVVDFNKSTLFNLTLRKKYIVDGARIDKPITYSNAYDVDLFNVVDHTTGYKCQCSSDISFPFSSSEPSMDIKYHQDFKMGQLIISSFIN